MIDDGAGGEKSSRCRSRRSSVPNDAFPGAEGGVPRCRVLPRFWIAVKEE